MRPAKKQEGVTYTQSEKSNQQKLNLSGLRCWVQQTETSKYLFKTYAINFKNNLKDIKEHMIVMSTEIRNQNGGADIFKKKNKMEILQLKNTIIEMKNSLNGLNNRLEMAEEIIKET